MSFLRSHRLLSIAASSLLLTLVTSPTAAEPLDVTLFITSDVEIGMTGRRLTDRKAINHVKAMNHATRGMQRLTWPAGSSRSGQAVDDPRAVFIAGDLTRDNSFPDLADELYFRRPSDRTKRSLRFPALAGAGNHDWWNHSWYYTLNGNGQNLLVAGKVHHVLDGRVERYAARGPFHQPASAPPHHATRFGRLLVVNLNTSLGEPAREFRLGASAVTLGNYTEPDQPAHDVRGWLAEQLAAHVRDHGEKAPVLIVQHCGYDPFGVGTDPNAYRGYWWHPDYRDLLESVTKDFNVIGFFSGHSHGAGRIVKGTRYDDQFAFRGEIQSGPLVPGARAGREWRDFDGDGRADFCRVVGDRLEVTPSTGVGFGEPLTSPALKVGHEAGRRWCDFDGDGTADYCRVVDGARLEVTFGKRNGFGETLTSQTLDIGFAQGRDWIDADGDGRDDFVRVIGSNHGQGRVAITLAKPGGFGTTYTSEPVDVGFHEGRAWTDVDGDGKADYARVVEKNWDTGRVAYTPFTGTGSSGGFGETVSSGPLDVGFHEGRAWTDVDGDGKADYARVVVRNWDLGNTAVNLSTGSGFGPTLQHADIDPGFFEGRAWADVNGDGKSEYCRITRNGGDRGRVSAASPLSKIDHWSLPIDTGDGATRAWADVDGDGDADACRVVDGSRVACLLSNRVTTTVPQDSWSVGSGYCDGDGNWDGGFMVVNVTDQHLDVMFVRKEAASCSRDGYEGELQAIRAHEVWSQSITTR
ncbi:MAG: VCBS repeat-containing protein [Acidobacteriota bacterium]